MGKRKERRDDSLCFFSFHLLTSSTPVSARTTAQSRPCVRCGRGSKMPGSSTLAKIVIRPAKAEAASGDEAHAMTEMVGWHYNST